MDKNIAIQFDGVGKQYRLGLVGTGSLQHDINRWWQTSILGKEDPYLKIGEVNDRSKKGTSDYVWALKDISFKVEQGDVVGIIGKNGAGKSTLLKLLSHITAPSTGHISYRGRIASLLEVGTGFHPEMTARDNIYMNGSIMGMGKHEIDRKLDEIVDFAGIERYIDTPVKRFSSGMTVRLGFAVAAFLEPEILVVDEVLAVGDAEFQKKAIGKMQEVSSGGGRTVLFVSHNMAAVKRLCKSGILLENGQIAFSGTAQDTISRYLTVNIEEIGKNLLERKDRIGNGKVRFCDVVFKDVNGNIVNEAFSGQYLKVEVFFNIYDKNVDLSKAIFAFGILDSYGENVTSWISDEMEHDFSKLSKGYLTIEIPALYLRPQTYSIRLQLSVGTTNVSDFCDQISNAATLTVLNDDVFVKGMSLKEGRGHSVILPANFVD